MSAPYLLRMWRTRLQADVEQIDQDIMIYCGHGDRALDETMRKIRSLVLAAKSLAGVEAVIREHDEEAA